MTKTELVDQVAEKVDLSKRQTGDVVDAVFEAITASLSKGDRVQLVGFGSFEVRKREARKGRNPQTKEEIRIAARTVPAFKAGKALKDAVAR